MPRNPWYRAIMRELRAGRMTAAEAARLAGVSKVRVRQWCAAAGFDPVKTRADRLAVFYARELLRMNKRERARIAGPLLGKARKPKRARIADKHQARAETDAKVIDFLSAGGKITRGNPV